MFQLFLRAASAESAQPAVWRQQARAVSSPGSANALLYLMNHSAERITTSGLARALRMSTAWASRAVDELVSAGLVERVYSDDGLRGLRIKATSQASLARDELYGERTKAIAVALGEIPPERRHSVARFLRRLTMELEKRLRQRE